MASSAQRHVAELLERKGETERRSAPFYPCSDAALHVACEFIDKWSVSRSEPFVIYELGCGDARVLRHFAARWPHSKCVGVEIDGRLVGAARRAVEADRAKHEHFAEVTIEEADAALADLCDCSLCFLYMGVLGNSVVAPALRTMKKGSYVLSVDYEMHVEQLVLVEERRGVNEHGDDYRVMTDVFVVAFSDESRALKSTKQNHPPHRPHRRRLIPLQL